MTDALGDDAMPMQSSPESPITAAISATSGAFAQGLMTLQQEWRRFERERNQWHIEREELMAKLTFLEGECRGFDILKMDLMRRIKMLEYALKQERAKSRGDAPKDAESPLSPLGAEQKPKASDDNAVTDLSSQMRLASLGAEEPFPQNFVSYPSNSYGKSMTLSRGRPGKSKEIIKKYLQEIGYMNTSSVAAVDAKVPRADSPKVLEPTAPESASEAPIPQSQSREANAQPTTSAQSIRLKDRRKQVTQTMVFSPVGEESSQGQAQEVTQPLTPTVESPIEQSAFSSGNGAFNTVNSKDAVGAAEKSLTSPTKSKRRKKKTAIRAGIPTSVEGNELADLKLESPVKSEAGDKVLAKRDSAFDVKLWRPKYTLRSHFDTVRALAFHPNDFCLLTASDDGTIKYWNLETVTSMKKAPVDIDPLLTFRGGSEPVTCLAISTMIPPSAEASMQERLEFGTFYSSGLDGIVRVWGLPDKNTTPYGPYDYRQHTIAHFMGHGDAVWDLKLHSMRPLLASASADGSVRLWDLNLLTEGTGEDHLGVLAVDSCLKRLTFDGATEDSLPRPTGIDFVGNDQIAVSFTNSQVQTMDLETGKVVIKAFEGADASYDGTPATQINRIIVSKTQSLLITAHEDRHLKFFDVKSGKCVHSMVAHLDAIAAMDLSPNGQVLVTTGQDASVRFWDMATYACLQEFSAHRKKYDEAVVCAQFHPRVQPSSKNKVDGGSNWLATGGADSCAKIYSMQ